MSPNDLELGPLVGVDRVLHGQRVEVELAAERLELLARWAPTARSTRSAVLARQSLVGVRRGRRAPSRRRPVLVDRAVDDHRSGFWRSDRASSTAWSRSLASPVNAASSSRRSSCPSSGPGAMPSSRASSSPAHGRRGRPVAAPVERRRHQLARQLEVRGDRLVGLAAARGQAVGARQQRHLHLHRARAGEVAVHGAPVERPLVNEEAEREVGAGEPLEEAAEPLAGAQPPAEVAHHALAQRVVADEGHPPVGEHAAGGGLADVVEERAEAEWPGRG